jgi:hypothetical protein
MSGPGGSQDGSGGKKGETTLKLVGLPEDADAQAVRQIVQSLVGYNPNPEGMEVDREDDGEA